MRLALRLAAKGYGSTSPNPMVGAVLVQRGKIIGTGWHHQAGQPHAEIEALSDAKRHHRKTAGATLYITLEPCCTHGRTPPCTDAIKAAGIKRVVIGAIDPNPVHSGKSLTLLGRAGLKVTHGLLASEATRCNEAFNHWIVCGTPFVTVKAGMSLDGKIATAAGESKWITSPRARAYGMKLRKGADAILVGVNTILADNPKLTWRGRDLRAKSRPANAIKQKLLRRIVLDSHARTPPSAAVVSDRFAVNTIIVVTRAAPQKRVAALAAQGNVWVAPARRGRIDLNWLLQRLGREQVTNLLVEGGGEINGAFLGQKLAHRVVFFYGPRIIGGTHSIKGVGGEGFNNLKQAIRLRDVQWRWTGPDLMLSARCD
jgi:diaminohydroxyphosphoribosylaminopyrimidine deaminase/5-amino-6-(5-phosphoribosylamino)uracil reductase